MTRPEDDRRRYPRYVFSCPASIRGGSLGAARARVCDLGLGGVLLESPALSPGGVLQVGSELALTLFLPAHARPLEVVARVVRHAGRVLAASFVTMTEEALDRLSEFLGRLGGAVMGGEDVNAVPPELRARSLVERFVQRRCGDVFGAWLQTTEDVLWAQADRAGSDANARQLRDDAITLSRLRTGDAANRLCQVWLQGLPGAGSDGKRPDSDSELALVDPEGFETTLAVNALAAGLEDALADVLTPLRQQLQILGEHPLANVTKPSALAEGFTRWAEGAAVGAMAQRLGLGAGQRVLRKELGHFYKDLSRALDAAGLQVGERPSVRDRVATALAEVRHAQPRAVEQPVSTRQPTADHAASQPLDMAAVANLLATLPAASQAPPDGGSHGAMPVASQVLGALAARGATPSTAARARVEATDRVVNHLVGDPGSAPVLRDWVDQLTPRLLAASLADVDFFRRPLHPLLELVAALEHLAMFVADGNADPALSEMVNQLVEDAVGQDPRQPTGYAPLLARADALQQRCGERFRHEAVRAIRQLEGQSQRHEVRAKIQHALRTRLGGQQVHRVLMRVLEQAWQNVLELHALRDGESSPAVMEDWDTLTELHTLTCRDEVPRDTDGRRAKALSEQLMAGFGFVGVDPFLARGLNEQVRSAVAACQLGSTSSDDYVTYVPSVPSETGGVPDVPDAAARSLSAQVQDLPLGTVARFRDGGGAEHRLQLIWHDAGSTAFAFIHPVTGKVSRFAAHQLIEAMYEGRLRLLPAQDAGLVDRVLDAALDDMQGHVHYQESADELTGLHNATRFAGRVAELVRQTPVIGAAVGLLAIDHFDAVTGHCGFQAGEQLLRDVAEMLRSRVPADGYLAFLGGARFGVILPSTDPARARASCDALRDQIGERPLHWQGKAHPVTASAGLVMLTRDATDPDSLLSALHVAGAAAMEEGGNRLVVFAEEDEIISAHRDRADWLATVEEVIRAERIRLRVQRIAPVAKPATSHHHEVLMSAFDSDGEPLDLMKFIATAEAFNLMARVDRLVINKAMQWASEQPAAFEALGGIAINLSGRSLSDPALLDHIRAAFDHSGVAPGRVSFEITETSAIASMSRAVAVVEGIRRIGCQVALDDFGTGMASYSYLKTLPVDYVKIDGCFISDIANNPQDEAIVRSIADIARFMGIRTIAEYVESDEVLACLDAIGVDFAQGYGVARPTFVDELQVTG